MIILRLLLCLMLLFGSGSVFALTPGSSDMKEDVMKSFAHIKDKTVYFGHQSVGYNIIDGVVDLLSENNDVKYKIIDIGENVNLLHGPGFFHSTVGENGDPYLKINDFKNFVDKHHDQIDIAFFKFCYVDITAGLDVDKLFSHYKKVMDQLVTQYPTVTFVYLTAPLRVVQSGAKAWVKKLLNKPLGGAIDNVQRGILNLKIVREYSSSGHVFDLAKAESTLADGQALQFDYQGESYRSLIPDYTNDGKHLNSYGRKIIARELLVFLGRLAQ